jgi:hypothetical protein
MWLKLILAAVVLFHGIGHVLFLGPAIGAVDWAGQTGHSWALTGVLGDGPTRAVGAFLWIATIVLFVIGVAGFLTAQPWWVAVTVLASIASIAGIVLMWDGIATSSAAMALAVDVVILVALLVAHWPGSEIVGASS